MLRGKTVLATARTLSRFC